MKTSFLLFCILTFFTANGQAKFSKKCLTISESTVQSWSPGNIQVDGKAVGGVIYQIKAVLKKSGQLKFDSLFVDGKNFPLEVVKGTDRGYTGVLKKGDSITLQARQDKGVTYQKNSAGISRLISSQKDAVAFISIWVNGKRYLHPVSEFKKTSTKDVNR
jgi:hypothetical protein